MSKELSESVSLLTKYIEDNNYRGYDPYDALKSPLFRLPVLRSNKILRFLSQQFVKRAPINLRSVLFIKKGYNPVAIGLCIQAYAYQYALATKKADMFLQKIKFLTHELELLIPSGFSGACWGYDFDWEARNAKIPAYQPTVVATGIITNALYNAYVITGITKCRELVISSAEFILKDLNRYYVEDSFIFSYSPFDQQKVFNASMKGVRLLAQAFALTNYELFKVEATKALNFVLKYQDADGSWPYSLASEGGWIDNYHSGYILDCLDEYATLTNDTTIEHTLKKGYEFYAKHFVTEEGIPPFYHNKIYPVDCTSASQSILTLCRYGDTDKAMKVAKWMMDNMQSEKGNFYFRKFRHYTIKTSFMRWSDAWMFVALSYLQLKLSKA